MVSSPAVMPMGDRPPRLEVPAEPGSMSNVACCMPRWVRRCLNPGNKPPCAFNRMLLRQASTVLKVLMKL
ncbi:hypothetical protein D3C72_1911660 [compost metagenome]